MIYDIVIFFFLLFFFDALFADYRQLVRAHVISSDTRITNNELWNISHGNFFFYVANQILRTLSHAP